MNLPLLEKLGKARHRQRGGARPWWTAKQGRLQPLFVPILPKRPRDSRYFGFVGDTLDGSEANRTTTGDLPQPRPTSSLNLRTSLVLRTDNLLAGKRYSLS